MEALIGRTHEWRRLDAFRQDDYIYIPERDREFMVAHVNLLEDERAEVAYFDLYQPADEGVVRGAAATRCIARRRGVGPAIGGEEAREALLAASRQMGKIEEGSGYPADPASQGRPRETHGLVLYFGELAPSEEVIQATCKAVGFIKPKVVGIVDLERDYSFGLGVGVARLFPYVVLLIDPRQPVNPILVAKVASSAGNKAVVVKILGKEEAQAKGTPVRQLSWLGNDL